MRFLRCIPYAIMPGFVALTSGVALGGDMAKAKLNYARFCAACHGYDGMSLNPGVPNLRLNEGLLQLDFQILQKLKLGVPPKKPPMLGLLPDNELMDVIIYTRTIR